MTNKTTPMYFEAVPVERELPPKNGLYVCLKEKGELIDHDSCYENGKFIGDIPTHWLRPIAIDEEVSDEEIESEIERWCEEHRSEFQLRMMGAEEVGEHIAKWMRSSLTTQIQALKAENEILFKNTADAVSENQKLKARVKELEDINAENGWRQCAIGQRATQHCSYAESLEKQLQQERERNRENAIRFLDSMREYERESGNRLCYDERESSEFFDTYLSQQTNTEPTN